MPDTVRVSSEVEAAVADGRAVVALESAIITHGLPRGRNVEVACDLEERLRARDVVPATIGVVHGVPTVGLSRNEIELLGTDDRVTKASTRDLPVAIAQRRHAGTTVAATAVLAQRVGVRVFATGGVGGVHRGWRESLDESADLATLASTPITVVCAGVKSVLDVPATLERLETLGVTVLGYRTSRFPGFYVADSGSAVGSVVSDPGEVVAIMRAADALDLHGGVLVANPVPESEQLDPVIHDSVVADALTAAKVDGISGPRLTPYLLDHLQRATGGASLAANIAAVRNNVGLAGEIATAWAGA